MSATQKKMHASNKNMTVQLPAANANGDVISVVNTSLAVSAFNRSLSVMRISLLMEI